MTRILVVAGALMAVLLAWTLVAIAAPSIPLLLGLESVLWILVAFGGWELHRLSAHSPPERPVDLI